ncbi:GyrI-like domain-containing protein [Nocardioides marmotae]|uniref:GyrI-like domain-containing protein n=1 Tax=Nocardioides marmotae TaxID=2663857 RepID=UPI0013266D51|nr:GyrI-like domain-containing protein [Nocardioides marmotae]MBC9733478.1 GyrI-like domain-containing protein [Nocardioides marmotae]MTB84585.1 hypothetical protein [Nocardioides marmotae]
MKVDLKKELDDYRARPGEFRFLDLPPRRYLAVDGHGDPNTAPEYAAALGALYPAAYAVKALARAELDRDHVVPPLEALWWADDMERFTTARDKSQWSWTVLLLVPDWVPDELVSRALERVGRKRPRPAALDAVRLLGLAEGRCVQTLHVGPYDDEGPVLARLHDEVVPEAGMRPTGKHHEIYLSDPRRVEPARLRTILRQPVEPVEPVEPVAVAT